MQVKKSHLNFMLKVLILSIISTVFLHSSFAQNYTQMSLPEGATARLGKGRISDLSYSPDGKVLALASTNGIWLYETETYQEIKLLPIPLYNSFFAIGRQLTNIRFSVDGQTIVDEIKDVYKSILVWDVSTGECKIVPLNATGASFSPDRQKLTIVGEKKTIELWQDPNDNAKEPAKEDDDEKKVKIAYSPDGKTYAITVDKYGISIRDTQTHKQIKRISDFIHPIYSEKILLSPDGKLIAMLRNKFAIHVWDVNTGKLKFKLIEHQMSRLPNHEHMHYHQPFVFEGVAFSPDGKTLACGSMDGTIRFWDLNNGKLKKTLNGHVAFVNNIVYSPDGKFLASGSIDGTILVWNTETWENKQFIENRISAVSCLAYSPDGKFLAAGSKDGDIFLFDVEIELPIRRFTAHKRNVSRLLFSTDGNKLASAAWDRSARLWDIETEELLKTITAPMRRTFPQNDDYWKELLFTQEGNLLAINSETRFIHFWNVNTGKVNQYLIGHAEILRCFSLNDNKQILASYSADDTILIWDMKRITNVTDE